MIVYDEGMNKAKPDLKTTEDKVIHALLAGTHPKSTDMQGRHVMVIGKEVVPLEEGSSGAKQYRELKQKYGHAPVLTFVPQQNALYILCGLHSNSIK